MDYTKNRERGVLMEENKTQFIQTEVLHLLQTKQRAFTKDILDHIEQVRNEKGLSPLKESYISTVITKLVASDAIPVHRVRRGYYIYKENVVGEQTMQKANIKDDISKILKQAQADIKKSIQSQTVSFDLLLEDNADKLAEKRAELKHVEEILQTLESLQK